MSLPVFSQAPARIDTAIDKALAGNRVVGTVVLVAHEGQIIHRRAAGLADSESGRPMREEAIFRLASITKPLVTAAVLLLVREGRLDLHPLRGDVHVARATCRRSAPPCRMARDQTSPFITC